MTHISTYWEAFENIMSEDLSADIQKAIEKATATKVYFDLEYGTECLICGEAIKGNTFPLCRECRKRARKALYPEEYGKL